MIKLLQIELNKILPYKSFWILLGLYSIIILLGFLAIKKISVAIFEGATILLFPENWHWISWLASMLNIILAFIVIMYSANEFSFRTYRQNVIDGLNRSELLFSKIWIVGLLALFSTLLIFISGFIFGIINTEAWTMSLAFEKSHFLLLHFLKTITFLSLALLFSILIRKAAVSIILLVFYFLIEAIIRKIIGGEIVNYFPIKTLSTLIDVPFQKDVEAFMGVESADVNIWLFAGITTAYFVLFNFLSGLLLHKRSL